MSYDKTISADLYDQKWEDGTITITMKRGALLCGRGIRGLV